jgi:hypothetical protein
VLLNRIQAAAEGTGYEAAILETPEDQRLADILVPGLRKVLLRLDRGEGAKHKLHKAIGALRAFAATFRGTIGDIGIGMDPPGGVADTGTLDGDVTDLLVAVGEAAAERTTAVALLYG